MKSVIVTLALSMFLLGASLTPQSASAVKWRQSEVINLHCRTLTQPEFAAIAHQIFANRKYQIEGDMGGMVTGKHKNRFVEMELTRPDQIVIRWSAGYEGRTNQWLRNLKTDMLWRLAL